VIAVVVFVGLFGGGNPGPPGAVFHYLTYYPQIFSSTLPPTGKPEKINKRMTALLIKIPH
jgi:hypothetical protein